MIYRLLGTTPQGSVERYNRIGYHLSVERADILRVHDVREAVETVKIVEAMNAPLFCVNR